MNESDRDRACIEGMRAGNTRALEELYERYGDLLYSLALRIVRRGAEAEEVCQEAWVQAWRGAARYDAARGSVGAWLVTLARSRAIDRLRSEGARARAESAAGADPPGVAADASVEAGHRQMSERVTAALARLDARQRQVLELAYFSGLTQSEIASKLDAPLGTVKSWTRQGLMRLRELVPGGTRP
jgi:RNA polymerase sigma-70 factor (ECF subfamily)